jgi:hypothetical protein
MGDYTLKAGSCPHCGVMQQTTSTEDFCSYFPPSLPCLPPEPFASMIDVLTAAQQVENAIHANDKSETEKYLREAKTFLQYAHAYLETYQSPDAETVTKVIDQLNELISKTNNIPSAKLGTFQQQELYAFQGVLSSLYSKITSL